MGGRDNPFVQNSRSSSDSQGRSGRRSRCIQSRSCSGSNTGEEGVVVGVVTAQVAVAVAATAGEEGVVVGVVAAGVAAAAQEGGVATGVIASAAAAAVGAGGRIVRVVVVPP